jgi:hypothetical protein
VNQNTTLPGSYITPWTLRIFNALPGNPAAIGVSFAVILILVFVVGRIFIDGSANSTPGDFRLALIHILLTAYTTSAYAYLLAATTKTARELAPVVEHAPLQQAIFDRVGKHLWWGLVLVGLFGILINVYATNTTTLGQDPWDWQQNSYDALWMRVLGPIFCYCMGCLLYVLVVESLRLSKLSDSITSLDLLDLLPYKPLIRQGLTNALLVVGMSSVLSLFLLEPGYALLMFQILTVFAIFAWIGLMLPLRGIRKKISIAKQEELAWCQQALKGARSTLKSNADGQQSMVEIAAYKTVIESVRNWPFDSPTLSRFALYLLIPVGSIFGGTLVERALDMFLP